MLMISAAPSAIASTAGRAPTRSTRRGRPGSPTPWPARRDRRCPPRQRLLDQQQVELVEPAEVVDVDSRVGRVGVDLERHVGSDQLADEAHRLEVPARLDLELDAHVSVVDVALRPRSKLVERVEDADADAARDPIAGRCRSARAGWCRVARSSASSTAISSAALAIGWPLNRRSSPATRRRRDVAGRDDQPGQRCCRITSAAPSTNSAE